MFASWMALPYFLFSWGFWTVRRQWSKDYAHRQRFSEGCKNSWSHVLEIPQVISNIMHTCLRGMTPKHTILSIVEGVVRPEVDETRAVLVLPLSTTYTHVAPECISGTKVLNFELTWPREPRLLVPSFEWYWPFWEIVGRFNDWMSIEMFMLGFPWVLEAIILMFPALCSARSDSSHCQGTSQLQPMRTVARLWALLWLSLNELQCWFGFANLVLHGVGW